MLVFITTSTYLLACHNLAWAVLKLHMKHPPLLKINKQAVLYILYKYYYDQLYMQA